ncbi:hypothetical protein GBAR_LOCUS17611, partial [Geodia barretti]
MATPDVAEKSQLRAVCHAPQRHDQVSELANHGSNSYAQHIAQPRAEGSTASHSELVTGIVNGPLFGAVVSGQ